MSHTDVMVRSGGTVLAKCPLSEASKCIRAVDESNHKQPNRIPHHKDYVYGR